MSPAARSLLVVLGAATATLGAVLTARPFTSVGTLAALCIAALAVLAVAQLLGSARPWSWSTRISAVLWTTAAIVLATQPGIEIRFLAITVGLAMILDGAVRVGAAIRGQGAQQLVTLVFGLAGVVLGVLVLGWPDVTVAAVAVLLGARVVWGGAELGWTGVRGTFDPAEPFERGSVRNVPTALVTTLALAATLAGGSVSYYLHEGKPEPLGALTIPAEVPDEPGKLVGVEEFDAKVPRGARGWRILYTTTRDDGEPALSTALVLASKDEPDEPRPVLAWAHGTTGISTGCAPSEDPTSAKFQAIPGLDEVLDRGWAVVATDYIGLGTPGPHPYLIGQPSGRAVLDSVRAVRELDQLSLSERTVAWGHSQGGGAALWTGVVAADYAPDVDLLGVVGIAPASDLVGLVDNIVRNPFGTLFSAYVLQAYSTAYPDVDPDDYLAPAAEAPMRAAADLCVGDLQGLASIAQDPAFLAPLYTAEPTDGALGRRLRQNTPTAPIPVPTLIAQGEGDVLVLPAVQAAYVAARCAKPGSGPLDYRTYAGRDHLSIIRSPGSAVIPDLLGWTEDRFEGRPASSTC